MPLIKQNFTAGETNRYDVSGRYFSVRQGALIGVRFLKNNSYLSEIFSAVNAGFYYDGGEDESEWFDGFEVTSPSSQAVEIFSSRARIGEANTVSVVGTVQTFVGSGVVSKFHSGVLGTTPLLLVPASSRKFMLLQHISGSTTVVVRFGSSSDSTILLVQPGSYFQFDSFIPSEDVWIASSSGINQIGCFVA